VAEDEVEALAVAPVGDLLLRQTAHDLALQSLAKDEDLLQSHLVHHRPEYCTSAVVDATPAQDPDHVRPQEHLAAALMADLLQGGETTPRHHPVMWT